MISQRMARMALQSVRALAVTSLDASFLSLCQPCWKSFSAAGREHRANNVVYGWIVKLPTMRNCLAPVSLVQVVLMQIKANNCNSLYKSVILNVNIFQREKLHADVSLSLFLCTLQVLNVWKFGCITLLMFMTQTFRQGKEHFGGSARRETKLEWGDFKWCKLWVKRCNLLTSVAASTTDMQQGGFTLCFTSKNRKWNLA